MENIYFIQSGENGPIKIGTTKYSDVNQRLKQMQVGNPEELICLLYIKSSPYSEKQLHDKFAHCHYRGEWFKPCKDLLDFITELKDRFGNVAEHEFKRGKWSKEEIRYIYENMNDRDYEKMSIELNRPLPSLLGKINELRKADNEIIDIRYDQRNNKYHVYCYKTDQGAKFLCSFYTRKLAEEFVNNGCQQSTNSNEEYLKFYNHPAERKRRGMRVYDFEWEQYGLPIPEKD